MAGLVIDEGMPRIIDAKTHGIIDYIHAATNFVVGALFWKRNKRAAICAMGLGADVLFNALMTDYPLGVFRVYSFKTHGILDYTVAATCPALPLLLGFSDEPEATYFYAQGGGEAVIAGITDYDDDSGSRRRGRGRVTEILRRRAA